MYPFLFEGWKGPKNGKSMIHFVAGSHILLRTRNSLEMDGKVFGLLMEILTQCCSILQFISAMLRHTI